MVAVAALEKSLSAEQAVALREHLMRSLRRWRANDPEDLAQEVLLRILSKLQNGLLIMNPFAFAHRVAVHVLQEDRRSRRREFPLRFDLSCLRSENKYADEELLRCLDVCLRKCLSRAERVLLQRYDEADATGRQALAAKQGLTQNALRIKCTKCDRDCVPVSRAYLKKACFPTTDPLVKSSLGIVSGTMTGF